MSKKRTSAESNEDEEQNEGSDSLSQQENNAKRAKLSSLSDTKLQDLPMELLECILIKVVVMEVKGMKLAKSVWKEKADLVISRLRTVCPHWNGILTTNFFRNELHKTLDGTAQETIRLEILHQSVIHDLVFKVTTTRDEMFMLDNGIDRPITVYNRNNMAAEVKYVRVQEGTSLQDIAGCSVSDCVYALGYREGILGGAMFRITKDEEHKFNISPFINDIGQASYSISVSTNGNLMILYDRRELNPARVSIYDAKGCLQHNMMLSPDILLSGIWDNFIQKSNGNLVLVSKNQRGNKELIEIDATGSVIRKSSLNFQSSVSSADTYGRFVISERDNGTKLLDSELNLLDFTGPHLNGGLFDFTGPNLNRGILHYNCERNEVVSILCVSYVGDFLTIFRFTED